MKACLTWASCSFSRSTTSMIRPTFIYQRGNFTKPNISENICLFQPDHLLRELVLVPYSSYGQPTQYAIDAFFQGLQRHARSSCWVFWPQMSQPNILVDIHFAERYQPSRDPWLRPTTLNDRYVQNTFDAVSQGLQSPSTNYCPCTYPEVQKLG